jgi:hypothetical protein
MDWVLDHLQVLFVIAVAAVAVLQKLKQARSGEAAVGPPAEDPEQAERTRRIQEEIRRRIMERRGLVPMAQAEPEPEPDEEAPMFPVPPPMLEEVRPVVVPPALQQAMEEPAVEVMSESNRQQAIVQQFRDAQAELAAGRDRTSASATFAAAATPGGQRPAIRVMTELRTPDGLRRAVLLREILGPPVGLR